MGIVQDTSIMKDSFIEARDLINIIFKSMNAPADYYVAHMTFDELVVALKRIRGLWDGSYREPITANAEDIKLGKTVYDQYMNLLTGTMPVYENPTFYMDGPTLVIEQPGFYNKITIELREDPVTAEPKDVLINKTYYGQEHEYKTGTMPDYGNVTILLSNAHNEIVINDEGHYDSITVKINDIHITYIPNAENQPSFTETHEYGTNMRITNTAPTDSVGERDFEGWGLTPSNQNPDYVSGDYIDSNNYHRGDNIPLYGIWSGGKIFIVYVPNVSSAPAFTEKYKYGTDMTITSRIPVDTEDEKEFKGWSLVPTNEEADYIAGDKLSSNNYNREDKIMLYGIWEEGKIDSEIEIQVTYNNGDTKGKLRNGTETATVKVIGGCSKNGKYKNITREWEFTGHSAFRDHRTENDKNEYTLEFDFNQITINVLKITHTDKYGTKKIKVAVLAVLDENGRMSGQFTNAGALGNWFDSQWIIMPAIRGCYVKRYYFRVAPNSHSNSYDCFTVFGKLGNDKNKILYDFGDSTNLTKEPNLAKLGTQYMITDNKYVDLDPNIRLHSGNIGNDTSIENTLTKEDNIRQCRFFAYTTASHAGCVNPSVTTVEYEVEYDFDENLWRQDGENFHLTYEDPYEETGVTEKENGFLTLSDYIVNFNTDPVGTTKVVRILTSSGQVSFLDTSLKLTYNSSSGDYSAVIDNNAKTITYTRLSNSSMGTTFDIFVLENDQYKVYSTFKNAPTYDGSLHVNMEHIQEEPKPEAVSWSTGTDAQILQALKDADDGKINLATDYGWKVGDDRVFTVNEFYERIDKENNGYPVQFRSAKENITHGSYPVKIHAILADSSKLYNIENNKKSNFVVMFMIEGSISVDGETYRKAGAYTYSTSWGGSNSYTFEESKWNQSINEYFYNKLPNLYKTIIKKHEFPIFHENDTTNIYHQYNYFSLPLIEEITGTSPCGQIIGNNLYRQQIHPLEKNNSSIKRIQIFKNKTIEQIFNMAQDGWNTDSAFIHTGTFYYDSFYDALTSTGYYNSSEVSDGTLYYYKKAQTNGSAEDSRAVAASGGTGTTDMLIGVI